MPSNTTYKPLRSSELDSNKVNANTQGITGSIVGGTTGTLDYTLVDDCLLTGVTFFTNNASYGDSVNLQVVDTGGVLYPPGTVLLQVATNWYVSPEDLVNIDFQYPAKLITGLTLRVLYTSVSAPEITTSAFMNYKLHKVLV
jgi:hypothetical protein